MPRKRDKEELTSSSSDSDSSDMPILRPKPKKKKKKTNFENIQEAVRQEYYNPNTSERFNSVYNILKLKNPKWTKKNIKKAYDSLKDNQIVKRVPKKIRLQQYKKILANKPFEMVQMDIMDFQNRNPEQNEHYKYVVMAIDVFSRKIWGVPTKTRNGSELRDACELIFQDMEADYGKTPRNIATDEEFDANWFSSLCEEYNIYHKATNSNTKGYSTQVIERVIATLKSSIKKNTIKWKKILQQKISQYNKSIHSWINTDPNWAIKHEQVFPPKSLKWQIQRHKKYQEQTNDLKKGDTVRIRIIDPNSSKNKFIRGDDIIWSNETYSIYRQLPNKNYMLLDSNNNPIDVDFPRHKLLKVESNVIEPPTQYDNDNQPINVSKALEKNKQRQKFRKKTYQINTSLQFKY